VRRRAAEKALFLTPTDGWVAAPSPVLRPRLDYDVCGSVPKIRPAELTTTLDGETAVLVREDEPETAPAAPAPPEIAAYDLPIADAASVAPAPAPVPVEPAVVEPLPVAEPAPSPAPIVVDLIQAEPVAPALAAVAPLAASALLVTPPPVFTDVRSDFDLPSPPAQDAFPGAAANESFAASVAPAPAAQEPEPELFERPSPPAPWPGYQAVEVEPEPFEAAPVAMAASADLFDRPIYPAQTFETAEAEEAAPEEVQPLQFKQLPLVVLLLVGLALFAGAMFWGSHARPTGGLFSSVNVGVAFGLVGILCAVSAGYTLLKRLGEREE
jgi:lysozyme